LILSQSNIISIEKQRFSEIWRPPAALTSASSGSCCVLVLVRRVVVAASSGSCIWTVLVITCFHVQRGKDMEDSVRAIDREK
jgi:hypothetical protein